MTLRTIPIESVVSSDFDIERDYEREKQIDDGWKYWRRKGSGRVRLTSGEVVQFSSHSTKDNMLLLEESGKP